MAYHHIGAGPRNVIAIFDTARGANAGNAPCIAQMERRPKDWLQSLKAGPPLPWSDGTTEPNGRRSNFSHKNCPRKRPAADGGAAVVAILGQRIIMGPLLAASRGLYAGFWATISTYLLLSSGNFYEIRKARVPVLISDLT